MALSAIWTLDKWNSIHCWVPLRAFPTGLCWCSKGGKGMALMCSWEWWPGFCLMWEHSFWYSRTEPHLSVTQDTGRVPLAVPAMESIFRETWDRNISTWVSYLPFRIWSHHLFLKNSSVLRNASHLNEPLKKPTNHAALVIYVYVYMYKYIVFHICVDMYKQVLTKNHSNIRSIFKTEIIFLCSLENTVLHKQTARIDF